MSSPAREPYSIRAGLRGPNPVSLEQLNRYFRHTVEQLQEDGFFQMAFGYTCVDAGRVPGEHGTDAALAIMRFAKRDLLWPPRAEAPYPEDELFDLIEFVHWIVAKGEQTPDAYHSWNDCGWHFSQFDVDAGREHFRNAMNDLLALYGPGYELRPDGTVWMKSPSGLEKMLGTPVAGADATVDRVEAAKRMFLRAGATWPERQAAIVQLGAVLEEMRVELQDDPRLSEHEDALFTLLNQYNLRHVRSDQLAGYDKHIWYPCIFYQLLAVIHAATRVLARPLPPDAAAIKTARQAKRRQREEQKAARRRARSGDENAQ